MFSLARTLILAAPLLASAHPHDGRSLEEIEHHERSRRALDSCASKRAAANKASVERRAALADRIRKERGITLDRSFVSRRDAIGLNTSHLSDKTGLGAYADPADLFDANTTCVLGPDVTEGPYFVEGEYVRYDLSEDQAGVPLYLDVELVDTSTCENVDNIAVEIWACNATGVYSGVNATANYAADPANLNTTFLRGIQYTNAEGYVQFKTIYPGHYSGRTQHIHIASHIAGNGTWEKNGTFQGLYMTHIGQIFFDEDLSNEVEATDPYTTNTQNLTTNAEDSILLSEADVYDPFVEYVLLGSDITDGVLAWASLGINTSEVYSISAAAYLTSSGGVTNPNSGMGGGGGPPNGTAPVSGSASAVATKK